MRDTQRSGFALLAVLLTLLALLVLCTPFLLMARNANQASVQLAERTETRMALDSAQRHGRLRLSETYPSLGVDETPYFDSLEELEVTNQFRPEFLDANDTGGVMWDLDVSDLTGRVDLDSASPLVIANLLGLTTRVAGEVEYDAEEFGVRSTAAFDEQGFFWSGGELVFYEAKDGNTFKKCSRGLLVELDDEDKPKPGGPMVPIPHDLGTTLVDQRAFAPVMRRLTDPSRGLHKYESKEELRESDLYAMGGPFDEDAYNILMTYGTVHADVRGGMDWQRPVRLTHDVEGDYDGELHVDDASWFNPGTTIEITDGQTTELAIVIRVDGGRQSRLRLDRVLVNSYEAYASVVRPQLRRPVNLNTAPPEVLRALFLNLQLVGKNSRITSQEATRLVNDVIDGRPFEGQQDFLARVVFPAAGIDPAKTTASSGAGGESSLSFISSGSGGSGSAGEGYLDPHDALALYLNGLNANDGALAFSTMPFCFTSRDTFTMDLRASVNAQSGVQRSSARREVVELIVPQQELLQVWTRQEDYDDALRVNRDAYMWASGPNATSRYDGRTTPPRRVWPHMGNSNVEPYMPGPNYDPTVETPEEKELYEERVFASREERGFAQLWATRTAEAGQFAGRVEHFDDETRDPEGRYLPDATFVKLTSDEQVDWTTEDAPFVRALGFSMWVKPRSVTDATLLDIGHSSLESDRISLLFESGDLVLRCLDAVGDHPDSAFREIGELRFGLAPGEGPGLPVDTWSHVQIDVRGNRPDQMTMLVNGMTHGVRNPGISRLTSGVGIDANFLPLEDIEGFPEIGVARVGNMLVEYTTEDGGLRVLHNEIGPLAGFGGWLARERHDSGEPSVPSNLENIQTFHPAETPVTVYGYSNAVTSNVPSGEARLPSDIGPFRVSHLVGAEGSSTSIGDPIAVGLFTAGNGIEGDSSEVTGLHLRPGDNWESEVLDVTEYMEAFHREGGYAAIAQISWNDFQGNDTTVQGTPLGGIEIVRYSGWSVEGDGDEQYGLLNLVARGDAVPELANLNNPGDVPVGGRRAFVFNWGLVTVNGVPAGQNMHWAPYVFPISLPVPGTTGLQGFLPAEAGRSEFAQITNIDQAELTEWVRYDWFETQNMQLVRDDPNILQSVLQIIAVDDTFEADEPDPNGPGGGGAGGGGGGSGGGGTPTGGIFVPDPPLAPEPPGFIAPPVAPPVASAGTSAAQSAGGTIWDPYLGEEEDTELPLTRAVRQRFQFRGVFNTYPTQHTAGTLILPAFHVALDDLPDVGRPGRFDSAFLVGDDHTHPGWPVTVHMACYPALSYRETGWNQPQGTLRAEAGDAEVVPHDMRFAVNHAYVALQAGAPEPMPMGSASCTAASGEALIDSRCFTRLVKYPSGERPRQITRMAVGGGYTADAGVIPSAVVDELVFSDTDFGRGTPNVDDEEVQGPSLVLRESIDSAADVIQVEPKAIRTARGTIGFDKNFLEDLPEDGALLRIGEEILAYESRDPEIGEFVLSEAGRGLLGTEAQPHSIGEPVIFLEHHTVSSLSGAVAAGDAYLPLADTAEFPPQSTVLVGRELMHYTRHRQAGLEMPRFSKDPGDMDESGAGLFRGRYGSVPQEHPPGAPVILFPFRYWDRWSEGADAPELSYFYLSLDQPAAFWRSVFWTADGITEGGPALGVLQRTDPTVPWDADPDETEGLTLMWEGKASDGEPLSVNVQSDRVEWRVFVDFPDNAFDYERGLSHAWKETPQLDMFGAFYIAPSMTLRSVSQ